jgi:hypothetical protein
MIQGGESMTRPIVSGRGETTTNHLQTVQNQVSHGRKGNAGIFLVRLTVVGKPNPIRRYGIWIKNHGLSTLVFRA